MIADPSLGAAVLARAVREGEISSAVAVQACLARLDLLDGRLHAFLRVDREGARRAAEDIDRRRSAGEPLGPLAGVSVAVKDNILTAGLETTAGSRILAGFVPAWDAEVVRRLRAADAIILGKTNLDEFAMGSSTEQSAFGPTRNPWNLDRVPGGSSGGSAAAVAARLCPLALGSDTGGSIRQPAAFTGVVGFKPSHGAVSRRGLVAYAASLDQIGPLAGSVADAALLFDVIAGADPLDSTSCALPPLDGKGTLQGLRLGLPREYYAAGMQQGGVESVMRAALDRLAAAGAILVDVDLPRTALGIATYYVIAMAEASSHLARFDGLRYGRRAEGARDLGDLYARSRGQGLGREVRRRILLGTFVLSAGYQDAYYHQAQRLRGALREDFRRAFARCDLIIAPTAPTTAFALGAKLDDPLAMYACDVLTVAANLAGLPALSLPAGLAADGLPVGLQLMARPLADRALLAAAAPIEQTVAFVRPERLAVESGVGA